jgi:GTPase SAR1 family protein
VYAIDNRKSFEGLDCLMEMILKKNHEIDFRKFPCCLIGTKMDKEKDRQVTRDEGITFASERGFDFFEVNSKQRVNIDEVFVKLCPRVYEFGGRPPVASNKSLCKTQ